MANFIDNIKQMYKNGNVLIRFIFINVFVFLVLFTFSLVSKLFYLTIDIKDYIAIPSGIVEFLHRPWTIITYMFVHYDLFHILFNMLFLFGFGRLFLSYFTPKTFGSLYILGGIGGGALYLLLFNTIPYFVDMGSVPMVGASASAMAIVFGVAFYVPQTEVSLFLFGRVKLIYIAIALFVIDFIFISFDKNPGGHIAHMGGALAGYIFAKQYLKGKDITRFISGTMDKVANLFKPSGKKKMKIKYKRAETDYEYNARKKTSSVEIDTILDKIKKSGYSSLSSEEKKRLFDASKN